MPKEIDAIHDKYGYIVDFDGENEICVGVLLESRQILIYYLNRNDKGDFGGWEIISEEEMEYEMLIWDFPDALSNCENAEIWLRQDIIDDDDLILALGNKELEEKSFSVLGVI